MLTRFLRLLGIRRRKSAHLTPDYESRRIRELRTARERFTQGLAR